MRKQTVLVTVGRKGGGAMREWLRDTNYYKEIDISKDILQHRNYSLYFAVTFLFWLCMGFLISCGGGAYSLVRCGGSNSFVAEHGLTRLCSDFFSVAHWFSCPASMWNVPDMVWIAPALAGRFLMTGLTGNTCVSAMGIISYYWIIVLYT